MPSVCSVFWGLGGTSIKDEWLSGRCLSTPLWGGKERGLVVLVVGTLLGCEAARVSVWSCSLLLLLTVVGGGGCGGVVCQLHSGREHLVSNFLLQIVQCFWSMCSFLSVSKLLRAYGGCLGTRSR